MNKIYKVVWSKAKNTYVVASELAKSHTKAESSGKGMKKLAAAVLAAMVLMGPGFAYADNTVTVNDTAGTAQTVYTEDGANNTFAKLDNLATVSNEVNTLSTQVSTNASNIKSNSDKITKLETAVGDKDSGLTKDVNDLKTTVGDSTGGLVKEVADNAAGIEQNKTDIASNSAAIASETAARESADTTLQSNIDTEKSQREAADSALDSRTSALESKTGSLNRVAAAHSTSINESMTLKGKQYSATLQVNGSGAQIGAVNNSAAGLGNDGGMAYTEYRSRTGMIVSKAANDISSTSTDGQIVDTAGSADGEYSKIATSKSDGTTFTYSDGTSSSSTTIKGDSISTGTVSATAGIVDGTTSDGAVVKADSTVGTNLKNLDAALVAETAAREAGNTELNNRITEVKNYLQQDAADTYVSKDDAAVEDGYVIKKANKIGENVALVDKALSDEAAARVTADKAQNEAIATVNTNLVTAVNTINQNMSDGFTALNAADAAEKAARIGADTSISNTIDGGLSLDENNVIQKTTSSIDAATGEVTTSKAAATEMILNKDKKNQITMNQSGIKVGTNSTVVDEDGVYTGGDTYNEAKAAMSSDGSIKGANGKFTVNSANGTVNVNDQIELNGATGVVKANGLNVGDGNFKVSNDGNVATRGTLSAADGKFAVNTDGGVSAAGGKAVISSDGKVTATGFDAGSGTIETTGTIQGGTITDGTASLSEGKLTGLESVETKTLKTTGDAEIGGSLTVDKDLTVKGEFNADTLNSKVDKNNYTTISGGNVTSKNLVMSDDGNIEASYSKLDEKGSSVWARDDDSKGASTVTADSVKQSISDVGDNVKNYASHELSQNTDNKYEITDSVVEGNQSNVENRTADTTDSQISLKDDSGNILNKSYMTQNLKKILMGVEEGDNKTTIEQDANNITNTAANGTITNDADKILNKGADSITSQIGDGSAVKTVMNADGIANTATGGTISNEANDITNTAANKITNKALDVETDAASSIVNKVANDYGSNISTQTSNETKEEMSMADGKKASYIRGAGEEKSQLENGDVKTTIDTVAGQTNTNITDGTNISNNLQKADQIASSVTDGTSSTVVNQDAQTIASSITAGDKSNMLSSTVDKSEQVIKASDTEYSASIKTATRSEDALVNGSTILDIVKDSGSGTISAAVSDGTNLTGSSMTAKGITNSAAESIVNEIGDGSKVKSEMTGNGITNTAKDGTITNDAKDVVNKGTNSVISEVGDNQIAVKTDSVKAAYGSDTYTTWDANGITSATSGNMSNSAQNITNTAAEKIENSAADIENKATDSIKNSVGDNVESTMTKSKITESVKNGDKSNTASKTAEKDINIITDGTSTSTVSQLADSVNTSLKNGTQSLNSKKTVAEDVTKITDSTTGSFSSNSQKADSLVSVVKDNEGNTNTVTSKASGTTFENSKHSDTVTFNGEEKSVDNKNTTISGNTVTTGLATMDYADVMKDLGVRGNASVDGNTVLGKEGADTTLTVNSTSTFNKDVTMKENATVEKDLAVNGNTTLGSDENDTVTVNGKSTFNADVTMKKDLKVEGTTTTKTLVVEEGASITGGTTTDTLKVTGSSEFDGTATFNDIVNMNKGLSVTGGVTADTVTADSYKVGDKTYIDGNGINANNQKVTNVAAGELSAGSMDAVNAGQLYETNTRVSNVENRVDKVEKRVSKLDSKIDKVGANAAAMANLHPLEFDADSKWNIAAAVGSSGGETATALGAFYRPNENVMVNVSASMGNGENMVGGGVSVRLGHGGNKAKAAETKAAIAENRELRSQVNELTARMDALLSVLNPNMSKEFPDVPANHWAYEAVSRLAGNGIVEGFEDGKYHGERQLTRYEMAEIIYNALSKGAKAEKKLVEEFRPELQAMAAQKKA